MTPTPDKIKPFDEGLRAALEAYQERRALTQNALARELDTGVTQVCKYLNARPEGDVERLESIIRDVLHNEARRTESHNQPFDTPVTKAIAAAFEIIRETNDVALLYGEAGIGKSYAIRLYLDRHPSSLGLCATQWAQGPRDLRSALFALICPTCYDNRTPRAVWIVEHLQGSNRLIVVDSAQSLHSSALSYLFDLHDATDCPIALVGNPRVFEMIRANDQMFSRVGLKREIKLRSKHVRQVADTIVHQFCPDAKEELSDLATQVAEHQGHYRAVRKQVLLARKIKEKSADPITYEDAFRAAHTQLIRDYNL